MILLINPKTSKPSERNSEFFREPNLGILYLAAILEQKTNFLVDILDLEQFRDLEDTDIKEEIKIRIANYKIFGITSLTNTFHLALDIARIIKNQDQENIIVMGGPHVSFLYKEILDSDYESEQLIDFICIGESENSFLDLVKNLTSQLSINEKLEALKLIKGISYINSKGEVIFTGYPEDLIDVESLPMPARHKLPQEYYYYTVANVIVNRGCPNQCSFCSRQKLFQKVRIRSIESILSEIRDITSLKSYNFLNFYDNININRDFFERFCRMFLDNDIKIPWGCELRVDTIDIKDAKLLKEAGCRLVATGIESASEVILRKNFKYQDPALVKKGILNLKMVDLPIQAYFVLGLPGETKETFNKTIEFIKELPFDSNDKINYFVATPYPGSRLWDDRGIFNINIFENDFSRYDCEHIIFTPQEIEKETLEFLYKKAKEIEKSFIKN